MTQYRYACFNACDAVFRKRINDKGIVMRSTLRYAYAAFNVYRAITVILCDSTRPQVSRTPASATTAYGGKRDIDVILPPSSLRRALALAQSNRRHSHGNRRYLHTAIGDVKLNSPRAPELPILHPSRMCPISKARCLIRVACDSFVTL
jgi:hypothetical protein